MTHTFAGLRKTVDDLRSDDPAPWAWWEVKPAVCDVTIEVLNFLEKIGATPPLLLPEAGDAMALTWSVGTEKIFLTLTEEDKDLVHILDVAPTPPTVISGDGTK